MAWPSDHTRPSSPAAPPLVAAWRQVGFPLLVPQWVAFLRAMETLYAQTAAAQGEQVAPLSDEERLLAACWAAGTGLGPLDALPGLIGPVPVAQVPLAL